MNAAERAVDALYRLSKPGLFQLDPEGVHDRAIRSLATVSADPILLAALARLAPEPDRQLTVRLFDQELPLPLGIAAGLVLSDLVHHFVVLPLWVGNTGWHWP